MLEIARFFAWVLCPWHTLYDIPMAMMPCSYVPTTRKEGAITNLKEKATVPGNYEHQTLLANTSNCQIHFFYFQNRLQCFFMWYNMVRSVFSLFSSFKGNCIAKVLLLISNCVFYRWSNFKVGEAGYVFLWFMRVGWPFEKPALFIVCTYCIFVQKKLSSSKMSFYAVFVLWML